jgi:hypothetical protein
MNWIKANKFLSGFFAVMLVGIGVLGYFLFSANGAFDEASDNYRTKADEYSRLRHLLLYPNAKNLKALEAQKDEAAQLVAQFQAKLATREFPADDITPQQFQDRLTKDVKEILEKATAAHVEFPKDKFYLGFDPYETRPPEPDAVGPLTKQLKSIKWVMEKLIESKVTKLVSLKRFPLPEEKSLTGGTGGRRPERDDRNGKGGELVSKFPMDIEFLAKQKNFAEVLNVVVGATAPQFFIPRVVQVKNQRQKGPERGGPPGTSAATAGQPAAVLGYIVGEEQLEVSLRLEMVEFAPPKEGSTAKPKASK